MTMARSDRCSPSSDSVRDASGRVLIHCQAGISRSATICLAYLMKRKRVRLDEAFEFVRRRRSIISPNFSFMGQLLQFESQLLATSCAAEAAATASPLLGPKSSTATASASTTPTSPFIFNFPVSVVNSAYLHHSPITTSPGCWCRRPQTSAPTLQNNLEHRLGCHRPEDLSAWLTAAQASRGWRREASRCLIQDFSSKTSRRSFHVRILQIDQKWTLETFRQTHRNTQTQRDTNAERHTHTHTHTLNYQLNKLSMKMGLCCYGNNGRGAGHRKEGGILSSFLSVATKDEEKKVMENRRPRVTGVERCFPSPPHLPPLFVLSSSFAPPPPR